MKNGNKKFYLINPSDARRAGYYAGCMEQKKKQRGEDLAPKPVIIAPRPKIGDGGVIIRF